MVLTKVSNGSVVSARVTVFDQNKKGSRQYLGGTYRGYTPQKLWSKIEFLLQAIEESEKTGDTITLTINGGGVQKDSAVNGISHVTQDNTPERESE